MKKATFNEYVRPTQSSSSTHHAPFGTGSSKRSGLFVILYIIRFDLRLVLKALSRSWKASELWELKGVFDWAEKAGRGDGRLRWLGRELVERLKTGVRAMADLDVAGATMCSGSRRGIRRRRMATRMSRWSREQ